ncbi:MAG: histidine phosphatase family protein [Planctomycetota bacterium]|nr:histidine phosphatase family protein [Planctomycetota bacterium]
MSKQLLVLRHAKSDHGDRTLSDHDRPLNERGRKAAVRMGTFMRERNLLPDLVLCSSAVRTTETLSLLAQAADLHAKSEFLDLLYLASPNTMLEIAATRSQEEECVLLVGHNPGSEDVLHLLGLGMHEMPTCSLAHVELDIDDWVLATGSIPARLVDLWLVKSLPDS